MRKTITITYVTPACVEFTGWRTRDLYRELRGRWPCWNTRTRRWVTVPSIVADLAGLAGLRGYDVVVMDEPVRVPVPVEAAAVVKAIDAEAGLW